MFYKKILLNNKLLNIILILAKLNKYNKYKIYK